MYYVVQISLRAGKLVFVVWFFCWRKIINNFHQIFGYNFNLSFPLVQKTVSNNNNNSWITEDLKIGKQDLMDHYKTAKETNSEVLKNGFKENNKIYNLNLVKTKKKY